MSKVMDDYIKREVAIKWNPERKDKREYGTFNLDDAYETGYEDKIKQIEQITAADVRENVRGKWIVDEKENPNGVDWCHCSVCGCKDITQNISSINFCYNCGADMRGGEKDGRSNS